MRKPFIIAIHGDRPLTDLQIRRRGMALAKSRTYRECMKRQRIKAKRYANKWSEWPLRNGLFMHLFAANPSQYVEAEDELPPAIDLSTMPLEQVILEQEAWKKSNG